MSGSSPAMQLRRIYARQPVVFYVVGGVLLFLLFSVFPRSSGRISGGSSHTHKFALMFDAGSTGSRVHVYKFAKDASGQDVLLDEIFQETKPGLSAFKANPAAAAASLDPLIDIATKHVPTSHWGCVPVALKATAGLRMIGETSAAEILAAVKQRFKAAGLAISDVDGVTVMDGSDEGVFAWVTVNYLLGNLPGSAGAKSAAIIDLGGGSTQVVFEPSDPSVLNAGGSKYKESFKYADRKFELYQHSHLGYGLMKANADILKDCVGWDTCLQVATAGLVPSEECSFGAESCSINGAFHPHMAKFFAGGTIYAFSFIYDRLEPFMPDADSAQHQVTVADVASYGKTRVCSPESSFISSVKGGNAQHCRDLAYIYALLHGAYKLDDSQVLNVAKKINGKETAWCLGASLRMMNAGDNVCPRT